MINKKSILAMAVGAALLTASSASAVLYSDIHWGLPLAKVTSSNPYEGTWDLLSDGYNPATHQIDSALATFLIVDDGDWFSPESYSINLDGNLLASGNAFFAFVIGGVTGNALVTLDQNGVLDYTVSSTQGDFYLKEAGLIAHANYRDTPPPTSHVPDGGTTLILLGLGLVGLVGAQRKLEVAR